MVVLQGGRISLERIPSAAKCTLVEGVYGWKHKDTFVKSVPIPEVNNDHVKIVVANSLHDVVFNSEKNGGCFRRYNSKSWITEVTSGTLFLAIILISGESLQWQILACPRTDDTSTDVDTDEKNQRVMLPSFSF